MAEVPHVRRVVLDAPNIFDFDNCAVRHLNVARYDRQRGDQQLHPPRDVRCIADVWPCLGRLTAFSLCSELIGPKNRAHLLHLGTGMVWQPWWMRPPTT